MKFTLHHDTNSDTYWNGAKPLPTTIHVPSYDIFMAELELLSIICSLHGHLTAFDILTGADAGTEKDRDMTAVLTAFQRYLYPRMPLSRYGPNDKRMKSVVGATSRVVPIDSATD
jgi:hypothetical protein